MESSEQLEWRSAAVDEELAAELAETSGVSEVVARLLIQRGIQSSDAVEEFLRPRLAQLADPFALTNLRRAVDRIEQAIEQKESVVIFGDYDVDGVTSTVQLVSLLRSLNLEPRFSVPRRLEEGYGLSEEAINRVFDGAVPDLFIALDCGTNAHGPIAYLRKLGVDVIIVDHHQTKTQAPKDCIFINPHVNDRSDAAWKDLCTAGLVFKLLHGLLKSRRAAADTRVESIHLKDYLDLVALGTIADLVPLTGENRILSWFGLHHLRSNGRCGVRALSEIAGIDSGQTLESSDISFRLAPRINASGRLADASLPIELLLSDDVQDCQTIARKLDLMNRERQSIERKMAQVAEDRATEEFKDKMGIVLYDESWHPGVVGIVASRVSRHLQKPTIILGAEGHLAKGSGRSVASVNLVELFQDCAELLGHWGGHPMAAGISLEATQVSEFTERFNAAIVKRYRNGIPKPSLEIATWIENEDLNSSLLEELSQLHPFGQANHEPIFGLKKIVLEEEPIGFGEGNFRFRFPPSAYSYTGVAGIAWRLGTPPPVNTPIDLAVRFAWNYWRNSRQPQATVVAWRLSN